VQGCRIGEEKSLMKNGLVKFCGRFNSQPHFLTALKATFCLSIMCFSVACFHKFIFAPSQQQIEQFKDLLEPNRATCKAEWLLNLSYFKWHNFNTNAV